VHKLQEEGTVLLSSLELVYQDVLVQLQRLKRESLSSEQQLTSLTDLFLQIDTDYESLRHKIEYVLSLVDNIKRLDDVTVCMSTGLQVQDAFVEIKHLIAELVVIWNEKIPDFDVQLKKSEKQKTTATTSSTTTAISTTNTTVSTSSATSTSGAASTTVEQSTVSDVFNQATAVLTQPLIGKVKEPVIGQGTESLIGGEGGPLIGGERGPLIGAEGGPLIGEDSQDTSTVPPYSNTSSNTLTTTTTTTTTTATVLSNTTEDNSENLVNPVIPPVNPIVSPVTPVVSSVSPYVSIHESSACLPVLVISSCDKEPSTSQQCDVISEESALVRSNSQLSSRASTASLDELSTVSSSSVLVSVAGTGQDDLDSLPRSRSSSDSRKLKQVKEATVGAGSSLQEVERKDRTAAVKQIFSNLLSSTGSITIQLPFPPEEHHLLEQCGGGSLVPVVVNDQEPSSIIAYALR